MHTMQKHTLTLAQELIAIESTEHKPEQLLVALDRALLEVGEYTIERFERNGKPSALIYNRARRPTQFRVILNAHLDVVPGKEYQFTPVVRGKRLYGMGALDMKANTAVLIAAFKELASRVNYPLALQLVTDEEIGGFDGTKYQIEQGVRADFVIAGETTNLDIVNRAKGILQVKIQVRGVTGHGAYPWSGVNAIQRMNDFVSLLCNRYPTPKKAVWATTVNVSRITTSNQALNKIPDDCTLWLDIRYVPEDADAILPDLQAQLPQDFTLEVLVQEPAMFVDSHNKHVQLLRKVGKQILQRAPKLYGANGSSDARHFAAVGCPGVEFGAVGGGIGTDEEWIDIASLRQYYAIISEFLLSVSI